LETKIQLLQKQIPVTFSKGFEKRSVISGIKASWSGKPLPLPAKKSSPVRRVAPLKEGASNQLVNGVFRPRLLGGW
jgi:hypothetical protein